MEDIPLEGQLDALIASESLDKKYIPEGIINVFHKDYEAINDWIRDVRMHHGNISYSIKVIADADRDTESYDDFMTIADKVIKVIQDEVSDLTGDFLKIEKSLRGSLVIGRNGSDVRKIIKNERKYLEKINETIEILESINVGQEWFSRVDEWIDHYAKNKDLRTFFEFVQADIQLLKRRHDYVLDALVESRLKYKKFIK